MNFPAMKARERSTENMSCRVAVRAGRSEMTEAPPSRDLYMVLEQPIATGRVRKTAIVARGMMPNIEHRPTMTNGAMTRVM